MVAQGYGTPGTSVPREGTTSAVTSDRGPARMGRNRDRRARGGPVRVKDRRIVIIGAGPGGLSSAHYLREAGYTNVTVLERAGEVGGTWQRNRYPGLACDVWSHVYSFTWNPNPSWTRSYAAQPEILAYIKQT